MPSLISAGEQASILATFENSFDTWSRSIIVYKEALKIPVVASTQQGNIFGFGEQQQTPVYTYEDSRTGIFPAVIRDSDISSTSMQTSRVPLSPEILARIVASPISMKVRKDCHNFIEEGVTERIVDRMSGETYLLDGHGCLQTYQGSEYYVYPLRKTQ